MSLNKMTTNMSQSKIQGYFAEGADLAERTIVRAGTDGTKRRAASSASHKPLGIVSRGGYENGSISVVEEGPAEAIAGGVATMGDLAILDSTGQKVLSIEEDPDNSSDEINVLGRFNTASSGDGKVVIIDVKPITIPNPKKTKFYTFSLGDIPRETQKRNQNLGIISATAVIDALVAPEALTITAIKLAVTADVTANDTNYWTFSLINEGAAGSGTAELLTVAGDVNTTKATGGTGFTADIPRNFSLQTANTALAAGDVLKLTATKAASGTTLAGTVLYIEFKTASDEFVLMRVEFAGDVTSVKISNTNTVTANDTDYWTWNLINKGASGVGTTEVLATASDANTTKA